MFATRDITISQSNYVRAHSDGHIVDRVGKSGVGSHFS